LLGTCGIIATARLARLVSFRETTVNLTIIGIYRFRLRKDGYRRRNQKADDRALKTILHR
jgi:hypothetical protein